MVGGVYRSPPGQLAIAQMRRGGEARFELCPVDACPKATPKTLAASAQALATPMPSADSSLPVPASASQPPDAQIAPVLPAALRSLSETAAPPVAVKTIVVTFASGSALLNAAARRALGALMADAQRSRAIEIRGRTDELGSVALNEVLARNRALAVRDYLRAQNLPEETTIRLSFKGACCYVAGNDTVEGRAANRRVEIECQPGMQIAQRTTHEQH
jgi:outer membrane protein OmpA-like peptidoglycan-associated protein